MRRVSTERRTHRGCLGLEFRASRSLGFLQARKQSSWLSPDSPQNGWLAARTSLLCTPGGRPTAQGPGCSPVPGRPCVGPQAASAVRPVLCVGETGPGLLSFPENLCAGQKEPLSPGLPGLLPRPVAQVSRAVPISQSAFSLCFQSAEAWLLLPSLTLPQPSVGLRP